MVVCSILIGCISSSVIIGSDQNSALKINGLFKSEKTQIYECTFNANNCDGKLNGGGGFVSVVNSELVTTITGYRITDVSSIGNIH